MIEDDVDERVALGRVLQAGGFEVHSYASAEGYLVSGALDPLCLLLDVHLEGTSGLDLLRDLRSDGSTLKVILMTGSDDAHSRRLAEELGCVAYLRKPFHGRGLLEILRTLARD